MADIGKLSVKIEADSSGVTRGIKRAKSELKGAEGALQSNLDQWNVWSTGIKLAAAGAATLAISQFAKMADTMTSVNNKLKLSTSSQEELAKVTNELFEVSNRSRSAMDSTVELYSKMERSTRDLGISQQRLIKLTETVNKSFALSGADAQTASGAIRQLGQALASGALRGDEFNSVAEGAPIILEAVTKATGKTVGQLRELAAQGGITAELLINSLEQYSATIDREYSTSAATFAQKTEIANNNLLKFINTSSQIKGTVDLAGDSIQKLSENLDLVINAATILASLMVGKYVAGFAASTQAMIASALAATKAKAGVDIYGASMARATVQSRVFAAAARTSAAAVAALGGPAGILIAAVTALTLFADGQSKAEKATQALREEIDHEIKFLQELNKEQLQGKQQEYKEKTEALTASINEQRRSIEFISAEIKRLSASVLASGGSQEQAAKATEQWTRKLKEAQAQIIALKEQSADLKRFGDAIEDAINPEASKIEFDPSDYKKGLDSTLGAYRSFIDQSNAMDMEAAEKHLKNLDKELSTALEKENKHYADSLAAFDAYRNKQGALTTEQAALLEKLEADHQAKLRDLRGNSSEFLEKLNDQDLANANKYYTEQSAIVKGAIESQKAVIDELSEKIRSMEKLDQSESSQSVAQLKLELEQAGIKLDSLIGKEDQIKQFGAALNELGAAELTIEATADPAAFKQWLDDTKAARLEHANEMIAATQEQVATEAEKENEKYRQSLAAFEEYKQQKGALTQEQNEALERLEQQHIEKLAEIAKGQVSGDFVDIGQIDVSQLEADKETALAVYDELLNQLNEKRLEHAGTALETLKTQLMTETQLEEKRYQDALAAFQAFNDAQGELTADQNALKEQLEIDHLERMKELKETPEDERIREENERILEALIERHAMIEETESGHYERQKQVLQQALEDKKITEEQYAEMSKEIAAAEQQFKMEVLSSGIEAAIQALSVGGKKASKIQKGLAIANAVIKGKEAAVSAWNAGMSVGGPWAPIVAAAYTAASIARTASMIKSIQSGGKSMGGMSGGGGKVATPTGPATGSTAPQQAPQANRNVNIKLVGGSMFSGDQIRDLVELLNEQAGDGLTIKTG